jgi:hypothetical protein
VTERPRQWDRKIGEARAVRKISVAVGLSALGLSAGLATAAANQGADVPPVTPVQPKPVAAEPRQVEEIDDEVIVPVSVPRPPERAPERASAAIARSAPAPPAQPARGGANTVTQAAPAAPAARAAVTPKPTVVSTGSPVR